MSKLIAYTDGSYQKSIQKYGCGVVLLDENENVVDRASFYGTPEKGENSWNINGELEAAMYAINLALKLNAESITIYHDYEGVGAWADHRWKTNKKLTKNYQKFVDNYRKAIPIQFRWVKGHAGSKWNEEADRLANLCLEPLLKKAEKSRF